MKGLTRSWILRLSFAVAIAAAAAVHSGALSAQISVSPLVLEEVPGAFRIGNDGTAPVRIVVELLDFEQSPDGAQQYLPQGQGSHTCGTRTRVADPPTVVSAQSQIRLGLEVAPGALCWGAVRIGFTTGAGAPRHWVIGKYYAVPAGGTRSAEITAITAETREGRAGLRLSVRSNGTDPVRPRGRVELRSEEGAVVATIAVDKFGVHPGSERYHWVALPEGVRPGEYIAFTVLDIGAPDPIAAQAIVSVSGT